MPKDEALEGRVRTSYQQLSAATVKLNQVSDTFGGLVTELDSALKKLNIGISSWVRVSTWESDDGFRWSADELGYDKVGNAWGIALRKMSGREFDEFVTTNGEWLFNDGPRELRIRAASFIPELLDKIASDATAATQKITERMETVSQVVAVIKGEPANTPTTNKGSAAKSPVRTFLSGHGAMPPGRAPVPPVATPATSVNGYGSALPPGEVPVPPASTSRSGGRK